MVFRVFKKLISIIGFSLFVSILVCFGASAQMLTGYEEAEGVNKTTTMPAFRLLTDPSPVVEPTPSSGALEEVVHSSSSMASVEREWTPSLAVYNDRQPLAVKQESSNSSTSLAETPQAPQALNARKGDEAPVDLTADSLEYDDQAQLIIATGNVIMVQEGRILRADQMQYNLLNDTARAQGNVVLNEENGDVHYSNEVEFNEKLKNGFIEGLKSYMADGSLMTAKTGERRDGNTTVLNSASYTPCEFCEGKDPFWQIKASKITHNEEQARISYRNARFELFGVPVAYAPYFSHPDGTIKRKSGFLGPTAGFRSDLGLFLGNSYYWSIAPDKDATFGLIAASEQAPIGHLEWRQRWDNAELYLQGGVTYANRITRGANDEDVTQPEDVRGHLIAKGLWDMNDKWRSGVNVEWASDDQYVRRFDFEEFKFSGRDVLESEVFAERFSGRNYAVGRLIAFQDVRIRDLAGDQPQILPEVFASFRGEPGAIPLLGGSWRLDGSLLGLRREGNEQDVTRFSVDGGWKRRLVSDYGLLANVQANLRSDVYNVRDRAVATPGSGQDDSNMEARIFPNFQVEASYPMVKAYENMQASFEPVVALTVAPNIDVNNDIPNEDSQDVQIDVLNIFEPNRFPGLDLIEDQSRVTYGLRSGLYGYDGSRGDVFIGQSYRLDEDDNPFPAGSGLESQGSDVVGQVSGSYKDNFTLDYRFQMDSQDFSSQRHELSSYLRWNRLRLNTNYLFASGLGGTEIDESREQIGVTGSYYVSEQWRLNANARQDLGFQPGLRQAGLGLDYLGQCVSLSVVGQRNLTDVASGDNNTEIFFRIGLKNIGEFLESDLRTAGATE